MKRFDVNRAPPHYSSDVNLSLLSTAVVMYVLDISEGRPEANFKRRTLPFREEMRDGSAARSDWLAFSVLGR